MVKKRRIGTPFIIKIYVHILYFLIFSISKLYAHTEIYLESYFTLGKIMI